MRHRRPFGCGMPVQTIVHPTKCNQVNTCTESQVNHIHPSHTTCVNHHLIKNAHFFPHTTSYQNTVDQVNVYGRSMPGAMGGFNQPGQWNSQNNMMR